MEFWNVRVLSKATTIFHVALFKYYGGNKVIKQIR